MTIQFKIKPVEFKLIKELFKDMDEIIEERGLLSTYIFKISNEDGSWALTDLSGLPVGDNFTNSLIRISEMIYEDKFIDENYDLTLSFIEDNNQVDFYCLKYKYNDDIKNCKNLSFSRKSQNAP